jgi:aminoglycoside 6'-N-acetyltransferase
MPAVVLPCATQRLLLRAFRPGDEADVLAYRGREDVARYLLFDALPPEEVEVFVAERSTFTHIDADDERINLAVVLDGHVIGDVMLKGGRLVDRQAEIGWVLHPDHYGHGYASEAARALLRMAFDELGSHRVHAQLDARNEASAWVCRALGMRQEALFRHDMWFKGEWSDTLVFALLEDEWRAA